MALHYLPQSLRGLLSLITSRVTWTILAILAQLAFLLVLISRFQEKSIYIESALLVLSGCMVLWIINRKMPPAYQMAWLIVILMFPVFGGLIYLILGGNQSKPYAQRKMSAINHIWTQFAQSDVVRARAASPECGLKTAHQVGQAHYIETHTLMPTFQHTQSIYYPSGEDMFEDLLQALEKAERYIFMEYFIIADGYMWQRILNVLERKVKKGVDVRLIYDDIGTIRRLPAYYDRFLKSKGIRTAVFGPFHPILSIRFNNRDHRKITVIDGHTAFTGGVNIGDEYINHLHLYGYWKDSGIQFYGQAATGYTLLFLAMWSYLTGEEPALAPFLPDHLDKIPSMGVVQPVADDPLSDELVSETTFRNLFAQATRTIHIFTPYLVLSNEMLTAIANAAKRDVDVHIVTPGIPDNKWYVQSVGRADYAFLINAGVHIYEYQPGFLHSKTVLVDGETCYVGTVNMDYRSMYLHFECGALLYNTTSIQSIYMDMIHTIENHSLEITNEWLAAVPLWRRVGRNILKIFAPLM